MVKLSLTFELLSLNVRVIITKGHLLVCDELNIDSKSL